MEGVGPQPLLLQCFLFPVLNADNLVKMMTRRTIPVPAVRIIVFLIIGKPEKGLCWLLVVNLIMSGILTKTQAAGHAGHTREEVFLIKFLEARFIFNPDWSRWEDPPLI